MTISICLHTKEKYKAVSPSFGGIGPSVYHRNPQGNTLKGGLLQ